MQAGDVGEANDHEADGSSSSSVDFSAPHAEAARHPANLNSSQDPDSDTGSRGPFGLLIFTLLLESPCQFIRPHDRTAEARRTICASRLQEQSCDEL